jgi:hypothetical protein
LKVNLKKFADGFAVVYPRHLGIMRKVIDEEKNCREIEALAMR